MKQLPECLRPDYVPDYPTTLTLVREKQEADLAFLGRKAMARLYDRHDFTYFCTNTMLMSSNCAEFADHLRAYLLTGRVPWKQD